LVRGNGDDYSAYFYARVMLWSLRWIPYLAMVGGEGYDKGRGSGWTSLMRPRLPCPIRKFDAVPPFVVEGCKSIFHFWRPKEATDMSFVDRRLLVGIDLDSRMMPAVGGPPLLQGSDFPRTFPVDALYGDVIHES
jgi:hypothetical protein